MSFKISIAFGSGADLASSPGHSRLFNVAPPFLRATLKRREWPGDEARADQGLNKISRMTKWDI